MNPLVINQPEFIVKNILKIFKKLSLVNFDYENSYSDELLKSCKIINLKRVDYKKIIALGKWNLVIATNEKEIPMATTIASILGVLGPANIENINFFYDKITMRKILENIGENNISFFDFNDSSFDNEKYQNLVFIKKPKKGTASKEVYKMNFQELKKLKKRERNNCIVEAFIDGDEFSLEAITLNGKTQIYGICKTKTNFIKSFVESSHLCGGILPHKVLLKIEEKVNKIYRHIKFDWGISHIEIKLFKEEVFFIEFHPRPGGGFIPQIIKHSWGNDFLEILKKLWTFNKEIKINQTPKKYSLVQFFYDLEEDDYKKLNDLVGVISVFFKKSNGIKVSSSTDRNAAIIINGENKEVFKKNLKEMIDKFKNLNFDYEYDLLD